MNFLTKLGLIALVYQVAFIYLSAGQFVDSRCPQVADKTQPAPVFADNDCSRYVICLGICDGPLLAFYHACVPGTVFDDSLNACVPAATATGRCGQSGANTTLKPITSATPGTVTETTPGGKQLYPGCPDKVDMMKPVFLPHPVAENCHQYIQCIDGGYGYARDCPLAYERLIFDPKVNKCVPPEDTYIRC